jgi:hypothetical protein
MLARGLFRTSRSSLEHTPMRTTDPFIKIAHVNASLRVIQDFRCCLVRYSAAGDPACCAECFLARDSHAPSRSR